MSGAVASSSAACAINAAAMGPARWALRPASSANASKMPNVDGPKRSAYQTGVSVSWLASSSAFLQKLGNLLFLTCFRFHANQQCLFNHDASFLMIVQCQSRVTPDPGVSRLHARLPDWGCDPSRFS